MSAGVASALFAVGTGIDAREATAAVTMQYSDDFV